MPRIYGPAISQNEIPEGTAEFRTLPNGAEIIIERRGGVPYFWVEGTFSNDVFTDILASTASLSKGDRDAVVSNEIGKVFAKLSKAGGVAMRSYPEVGYFTFQLPYQEDMFAAVREINAKTVLLNPIAIDRHALENAKAIDPAEEFETRSSRSSNTAFSGLHRMQAPEFVAQAQADIGGGVAVDGSSVRLGITDTGITFYHPTFEDAEGKSRIVYMRDFTREGRVYFNPSAKLVVQVPTDGPAEDLLLSGQVIVTPRLPSLPAGDMMVEVKDFKIKASAELKAVLTNPASNAKLGVLFEEALQSPPEDVVDINGNGKLDDQIYLILVPGASPEQDVLFVDATGTGDFRSVKPVGSWNATRQTVSAMAEKFGFDIASDELPKADGTGKVAVRSASLVGYDPGNHGTHVAGIAAGKNALGRGVAPAAKILMNRVCANNTGCNATEAFIDLVTKAGANVVNMSLGGLNPFNDGYGVQETAINRLSELYNVLFVISAGNSGPGRQTVGSPSVARSSLSVGASASRGLIERQYQWPGLAGTRNSLSDEFMLFFSSRGPTAAGGFKPNIAAPGTELSSIQLNSAPGHRAGLDVYWGTSMAAPAATGAYALLLDAVKKYNVKNPSMPLPSDSLTLRQVLISSAKPFDVTAYDPITGQKSEGQYTWADQGTGLVDLLAAWKKLFEVRAQALPSPVGLVRADGTPIELQYEVLVSMKSPSGNAYDGSRAGAPGAPAFGTGLYLDFNGVETLRQVHIARRLPQEVLGTAQVGELTRQLVTTADEFVLKTTFYGSHREWLKAGVLDQLNCAESQTADLTVVGRGAEVKMRPDGGGEIAGFNASALNVCLDRRAIAEELPPGDHGALISAYRKVNGREAAVPSFIVPVFLTVPHKVLADTTGYSVNSSVMSFAVARNYVAIPKGTTLVQVTLEVPPVKRTASGAVAPGEQCSGVELMALTGANTANPIKTRKDARISNCDANGVPVETEAGRKLVFSRGNPTPGIWDLHIFGSYKYAKSNYRLRVDYLNADMGVKRIEGDAKALTGSFQWTVKSASLDVAPDAGSSTIELNALFSGSEERVANGNFVLPSSPFTSMGPFRVYPPEARSVTVKTGKAPGSDLDLLVFECDLPKSLAEEPRCEKAAESGGPTDEESATFSPQAGKAYVVRVDGYAVNGTGKFVTTELVSFPAQAGAITVSGSAPGYTIGYSISPDQFQSSKLGTHPLFVAGKVSVVGSLILRDAGMMVLGALPVQITAKVEKAGN